MDATCEGIQIHSIPLVVVLKPSKEGVAATMQSCPNGASLMAVIKDCFCFGDWKLAQGAFEGLLGAEVKTGNLDLFGFQLCHWSSLAFGGKMN